MPKVVYLDVAASEVSASPATILNDGSASATVTVRVLNTDGNPMPNRTVTLALVSGTGTLTQPASVTNQAGVAIGSVVTSTLGTMVIKATVLSTDITQTASVVASGTAVTDPDDLRSSSYGSGIVFREFNSKAASDADRGTGSFPSKTGGSEGYDGIEWDDVNIEIPEDATALTWLSGVSPFGDVNDNVMVTKFPLGFSGAGQSPGRTQTQGLGGPAHLWVQFSIAFQDTFQAGPAGLNKLWFVWPTGAAGGTFLGVLSGNFRYNLQGTPDNGRGYLTNNIDAGAAAVVADGRWYTICMEFVATGNSASGEFRMWIADNDSVDKEFVQVAEYTDVNYGQSGFTLLQWAPVWGGVDAGMSVDPEFNYAVDTVKVWGY